MKKTLMTITISAVALIGAAFATQILPDTTTTTKPVVRPSLNKLLDRRPVIPWRNAASGTGKVLPPATGSNLMGTGKDQKSTGSVVRPVVVQQNAEDVKAFREENGYITRYLKKSLSVAQMRNVTNAVKTFLATQKTIRTTYEAAVNSGTQIDAAALMTTLNNSLDAYKTALSPYIDDAQQIQFQVFVIGRLNLLQIQFIQLKKIKNNNIQIDDSSSRIDIKK